MKWDALEFGWWSQAQIFITPLQHQSILCAHGIFRHYQCKTVNSKGLCVAKGLHVLQAKTTRHQIPNLETSTRTTIFFSILPYALIALKYNSHSPQKCAKKTWNQRCQQLGSSQSLDTRSVGVSSKHFQYLAEDVWPLRSKSVDADLHFSVIFLQIFQT